MTCGEARGVRMMYMTVHTRYACPASGGTYVELLKLCEQPEVERV